MNPQTASRLIVASIAFFVALLVLNSASYVIEPGTRGLKVTLGKTQEGFLPEGFGFKTPFITSIVRVNVRQRTRALLWNAAIGLALSVGRLAVRAAGVCGHARHLLAGHAQITSAKVCPPRLERLRKRPSLTRPVSDPLFWVGSRIRTPARRLFSLATGTCALARWSPTCEHFRRASSHGNCDSQMG